MKRLISKYFVTTLVLALTVGFSAQAAAHGSRDYDRLGERVAMTWLIDGDSEQYAVTAPANLRLNFVKVRFLATSGISIRDARNYVVEKVEETTTTTILPPTRGPNTPPGTVSPPPTTTTTTEYELLDGSMRLSELGIVAGDTLRIRMAEADEIDEPEFDRGHRFHFRHAKYDRDGDHRHHGHHRGRCDRD